MAKKKIGTAVVQNGIARGCFNLPESLPKGVYELIGEYKGSNIYRPSYDVKKLIIGWKTDILGLESYYKVNELERELTVTGRLVGYNDSGTEQPLANQKIGLKIGDELNPLGKGIMELSKEALTLKTSTNATTVTTDSNGFFTMKVYIPAVYDDWEYKLYVIYGGNYDYVSCIKQVPLYIGDAPTFTTIAIKPSHHLHPQGGYLIESAVYLRKDVDDNGIPKSGAKRLTVGRLIFKESGKGADGTYSNLMIDGTTKMKETYLSNNNGWVRNRIMFNRDETDSFDRYIYAQFSGSSSGFGYKSSRSIVVHLRIDPDGVKLENLNVSFPCAPTIDDVLFIPYNEARTCQLTIKNGTVAVPNGVIELRIDDD